MHRKNRFFPGSVILSRLDELVPLCTSTMDAGTILYRSRTIDRNDEDKFTSPVMAAVVKAFTGSLSSDALNTLSKFDYRHIDDAFTFIAAILSYRGEAFALDDINESLESLFKKSWWGYKCEEIDAPLIGAASDGRINPKGIRYLYASDNPRTALLEVRPVVSQMAGVAEIEILSNITLFDVSQEGIARSGVNSRPTHMDPSVLAECFFAA